MTDNWEQELKEFSKLIVPGRQLKDKTYLYHVLGIFDDEWVAVKYFGKNKRRWFYEFENMYHYYIFYKDGHLTIK
jgi:hypothetical protein